MFKKQTQPVKSPESICSTKFTDFTGVELFGSNCEYIYSWLNELLRVAYLDSFTEDQSSDYEYDVFLGGACNPTTWRQKEAIPILQSSGLNYYNPQKEAWSSSLVEEEKHAKKVSRFHLFVFDLRTTRCLTSMIEVANLVARNASSVILVALDNVNHTGFSFVGGEILSQTECEHLEQARNFVLEIARFFAVPIFDNLTDALHHLRYAVDKSAACKHRRDSYNLKEISMKEQKIWHKICTIRDIFDSLDSSQTGSITLEKARAGLHRLHADLPDIQSNEMVNFEQFCLAYVKYKREHKRFLELDESIPTKKSKKEIRYQLQKSLPNLTSEEQRKPVQRSYSSGSSCSIRSFSVRASPSDNLTDILDRLKNTTPACHYFSIHMDEDLPDILSRFNLGMQSSRIFYVIEQESHLNLMIEASFMLGCGFPVFLHVLRSTSRNIDMNRKFDDQSMFKFSSPNFYYRSFSSSSELSYRKDTRCSRESSISSSIDCHSPISVDSGCVMPNSPSASRSTDYYRAKCYLVSIAEETYSSNGHSDNK